MRRRAGVKGGYQFEGEVHRACLDRRIDDSPDFEGYGGDVADYVGVYEHCVQRHEPARRAHLGHYLLAASEWA